jgi:hypothetical protein
MNRDRSREPQEAFQTVHTTIAVIAVNPLCVLGGIRGSVGNLPDAQLVAP